MSEVIARTIEDKVHVEEPLFETIIPQSTSTTSLTSVLSLSWNRTEKRRQRYLQAYRAAHAARAVRAMQTPSPADSLQGWPSRTHPVASTRRADGVGARKKRDGRDRGVASVPAARASAGGGVGVARRHVHIVYFCWIHPAGNNS